MRKCPYCGTQMNDDSLFCTECGKPIPQGNVCPHCGASVNDGDTFCQNCGKKTDETQSTPSVESTQERCPHCGTPVSKDSVFCENCGKKIDNETSNTSNRQQPQPTTKNGNLIIRWKGTLMLIDYKIKLNVNGNNIGEYSLKEGFETSVPITSSDTTVVTKLSFFKTKEELILNPNENYTYELVYHKASGWLGFILYDSLGNELRRDKLHWGMFLLSFLFPIVGVIYAICVWKKKPASSYTAIYISILGVIISLIVISNLPPLSKFIHLPQNSAIESDVILTDLGDDSDAKLMEDIKDVHSEAYIKDRLQQICDEIPSLPQETLVRRYFSESFKELYNAVIKEDQIETQRGNIGFFDCDFWTGGRHGELKSVTILDLTNITELSALATVQDLIMFNEDNESKNSKDVHLIFENGDWYINDLSDYSGSRMSKRMQEYLEADDEIKSEEELAQTNTAIGAFDVKDEGNDSIQ